MPSWSTSSGRTSCSGIFFSCNQESTQDVHGDELGMVPRLVEQTGGYERMRRDLSWVRAGYVEEILFRTIDPIGVGPLPLKPFLLGIALLVWWPHRSRTPIPFWLPVILVAIGVPIVWWTPR